MSEYTISEECSLPSEGKVYKQPVNPSFRIRSMTTEEEMKRLAYSERGYQMPSEIIDDCIVGEGPGISSYDMCIGDYRYLLHQLRIATYGPEYSIVSMCPSCGEVNEQQLDLSQVQITRYSDINDFEDDLICLLPKSEHEITLRLQTPRMIDDVEEKVREMQKKVGKEKAKTMPNLGLLYSIMSIIDKVDGRKLNTVELENFVRKLPMFDTAFIVQTADELNSQLGPAAKVPFSCGRCERDYDAPFQFTANFFGPKVRP